MDRRKEAILRAITHDYIETAEPVGSRTIARRYNLGVSPATIRNEMADLEESGYLEQPHTSAGRIPSDKGYRFYVDVLMPRPEVSLEDRERLRHRVQLPPTAVEEMLRRAVRLLAVLTHYAGVALLPSLVDSVVRAVQFVPIDERNALVVVVTEPGFVQSRIVDLQGFVSPELLIRSGHYVTEQLRGKTQREITPSLRGELAARIPHAVLYHSLMEMLTEGLAGGSEKVYLEGSTNLIDYPEFMEIAKAKALLAALEEKERLQGLMGRAGGTSVAIGSENPHQEMHDCSVVSTTYSVNGRVVGAIGVIGPTRMEYTRAIALVESMAETLSELFDSVGRGYL